MGIGNALKTKEAYEKVLERGKVLLEELSSKDPKPMENFLLIVMVNSTRPV